ncbi:lysophospholipid acyltransferase family protein [Celeribacter halophilus]|uniref:Lysophospholipid acyltransferase family protein n=1 Tax=Celeribacter halophilus TaxID=576117 RepID=A0AAW7XP50_9RHOB|nr:lysophospholipid acyltransferase family protein [Celeribacter halophilus]MDO6455487.1 lysophospholipid acyltransferase family protein [Celeribacter halophilus]MDO6721691.1 lysophospholipid acyltransferase family protein [Celeribacter halophilus]
MSGPLWDSRIPPPDPAPVRLGTWRMIRRGLPIVLMILICMILMLATRVVERLFYGPRRPWTSFFPRFVSRNALRLMGMGLTVKGKPMQHHGAVVANHSTWLDIFVLNAVQRVFFVSKAEVAGWTGIGAMAKAAGTVFINRDRKEAAEQKRLFEERLKLGHKLLFFPEGTSSDSLRVLPYKPTLFAAFFAPELRDEVWIQPVTTRYIAPEGQDVRFYGWWGDMDFAGSLVQVLKASPQGRVEVIFHDPIAVKDVKDRKEMAARCEAAVRSGLPEIPAAYVDV